MQINDDQIKLAGQAYHLALCFERKISNDDKMGACAVVYRMDVELFARLHTTMTDDQLNIDNSKIKKHMEYMFDASAHANEAFTQDRGTVAFAHWRRMMKNGFWPLFELLGSDIQEAIKASAVANGREGK